MGGCEGRETGLIRATQCWCKLSVEGEGGIRVAGVGREGRAWGKGWEVRVGVGLGVGLGVRLGTGS